MESLHEQLKKKAEDGETAVLIADARLIARLNSMLPKNYRFSEYDKVRNQDSPRHNKQAKRKKKVI